MSLKKPGKSLEKILDSIGAVSYNVSVDHSERTGDILGSYQSGQLGLTVNQLRKLRRFESFTAHLNVEFVSSWFCCIARVAQR